MSDLLHPCELARQLRAYAQDANSYSLADADDLLDAAYVLERPLPDVPIPQCDCPRMLDVMDRVVGFAHERTCRHYRAVVRASRPTSTGEPREDEG